MFLALGFLLHRGKQFGVITGKSQITAEHGIPLKNQLGGRKRGRILTHPEPAGT
jgi:hypothetical protein